MPYWLWIGNNATQYNPTPLDNLTDAELASIVGYQATGASEIAPVMMNGQILLNNFQFTFNINVPGGTAMNYTDPSGSSITGARMTTAVRAEFLVYDLDANGDPIPIGEYTGLFVQMNNGDVFFRPLAGYVDEWSDIPRIHRIEILSTTRLQNDNAINPNIGFNPDIVDMQIVPCFVRGTMIDTDRGAVAVEDLTAGDLVKTLDNGLQPLRWIGSRRLTARALEGAPRLRPIRIRAGALGASMPATDLLVSPQHRVLVRSAIAQRMFGTDEILAAAKQLLELDDIEIAEDLTEVEYFHLLFDQHQILTSNGALTESFFTGSMALSSLGDSARNEIFEIFPELRDDDHVPEAARFIPVGRKARQLASRHTKNSQPLVCC